MWAMVIDLGCNKFGGIVKCQNIDKKCQVLQGGQSGGDVVKYIQRLWAIHIDKTRKD
jgi:hypothetical protein